jgi:1,6-anhydro-N-acetylmuramate kinase
MPLGELSHELRLLASGAALDARTIAETCHAFSLMHVELIRSLLSSESADLVAIHGQTVYHAPPVSWQLLQPAVVVSALGIPVVFDLRQADLAAGGQGAPLTPLADAWFLREFLGPWAVVNLGGFVNVTLGPELHGFDVCPCNLWLDTLALREFGVPFDAGGALATSGSVHDGDLERLLGGRRSVVANSLGTGDETLPEMDSRGADALRTAVEAVALCIADVISSAEDVFLAGGGAENAMLVSRIASLVPGRVRSYDEVGVPGRYREAAAWAWLGQLAYLREPTSLPSITGATHATIGGSWAYP